MPDDRYTKAYKKKPSALSSMVLPAKSDITLCIFILGWMSFDMIQATSLRKVELILQVHSAKTWNRWGHLLQEHEDRNLTMV